MASNLAVAQILHRPDDAPEFDMASYGRCSGCGDYDDLDDDGLCCGCAQWAGGNNEEDWSYE